MKLGKRERLRSGGEKYLRPTNSASNRPRGRNLVAFPRNGKLASVQTVATKKRTCFHLVEDPSWHGLVDHVAKRLLWDSTVLEFGKHELAMAGKKRAAGVAIVFSGHWRFWQAVSTSSDEGRQVMGQNRCLSGNGSDRFAGGQVGRVAEGKDVGVAGVAEGFFVDFDKPGCLVGERRFGDESWGLEGQGNVHHVIRLFDEITGRNDLERRHLAFCCRSCWAKMMIRVLLTISHSL